MVTSSISTRSSSSRTRNLLPTKAVGITSVVDTKPRIQPSFPDLMSGIYYPFVVLMIIPSTSLSVQFQSAVKKPGRRDRCFPSKPLPSKQSLPGWFRFEMFFYNGVYHPRRGMQIKLEHTSGTWCFRNDTCRWYRHELHNKNRSTVKGRLAILVAFEMNRLARPPV